jgi:flagellar assembly protein FliH
VFVGEKHLDREQQQHAAAILERIFPLVSVTNDPDGARYIPIEEVFKMEEQFRQAQQDACRNGREEGRKAGLQEGLSRAEDVLKQLDSAIRDALEQREVMLEDAKQQILDLVIQISRKVTFEAIELDPESTLKLISGVIDTLLDRSRIKIKVNPDHLPIVEQNINTFLKGSATIKEIVIEPDPRVRYGGCFIETPTGDIDARLESQFEVIRDTLLNEGEAP